MAGEITRLMVEVAVSQGLQGLKQQFDRRVLRNAVEHGGHFSNGRFQRAVFQTLQDMLRTEDPLFFPVQPPGCRRGRLLFPELWY